MESKSDVPNILMVRCPELPDVALPVAYGLANIIWVSRTGVKCGRRRGMEIHHEELPMCARPQRPFAR